MKNEGSHVSISDFFLITERKKTVKGEEELLGKEKGQSGGTRQKRGEESGWT